MALSHDAVGWSAVCDCGISWSYSLFYVIHMKRACYPLSTHAWKWSEFMPMEIRVFPGSHLVEICFLEFCIFIWWPMVSSICRDIKFFLKTLFLSFLQVLTKSTIGFQLSHHTRSCLSVPEKTAKQFFKYFCHACFKSNFKMGYIPVLLFIHHIVLRLAKPL